MALQERYLPNENKRNIKKMYKKYADVMCFKCSYIFFKCCLFEQYIEWIIIGL